MFRCSKDKFLRWTLGGIAGVAGAITLLVLIFLLLGSIPALQHIGLGSFFADASWHPAETADAGTFNLVPMILGTLIVTLGAMILATPVAMGAAIFSTHYAPAPVARVFRRTTELMAGIPSVVYGFWGLTVLVPWINQWHPPGQSVLAAILVLALMIYPTIAILADSSIRGIPSHLTPTAASLGLSRWCTVWGVVLPAARSGLFTSVLLGTGRAIGETLAVLMVVGNTIRIPGSLFDPARTLTSNIALEMAYAAGDHRSALFVSGLLLMLLILGLIFLAETYRRKHLQ